MKRHVKMSVVLIALLLAVACLFTGCKSKELEAQINDNATKAETADKAVADKAAADDKAAAEKAAADLKAATEKATADLADAKTALETLIANGDTKAAADAAAALAAAKTELEGAIEAAQGAAVEADAGVKAELKALIDAAKKAADDAAKATADLKTEMTKEIKKVSDALTAAEASLKTLIGTEDAKVVAQLNDAKTALEARLTDAENACASIQNTMATDGELAEAIAALRNEITDAINTNAAAAMTLKAWGEATDALVEGALADLETAYATYKAKTLLYTEDGFAKITAAYHASYIKMMRAVQAADVAAALEAFETAAAAEKSITDVIYDKLMEAGETVDDITLDDKATLEAAKALLDDAYAITEPDVLNAVLDDILAYGENDVNLQDVYDAYWAKYKALVRQADGAKIKAAMDEVLAELITLDVKATLASIRYDYDLWIGNPANSLADVDGFTETHAAFVAAEARVTDLEAAKTWADTINADILALKASITQHKATIANQTELARIGSEITSWIGTYFIDDYAAEIDAKTVNYLLVKHDEYAALAAEYAELVAKFEEAAKKFKDALAAIGEIDLSKQDEIDNAWDAYNEWTMLANLGSYDYSMDGGKTPADYMNEMLNKTEEHNTLKAEAEAAYDLVFADLPTTVTLYDEAKIDAMLKWYAPKTEGGYGVWVDGELVFDNGYVLATKTITEANYLAVKAMEADFDTLYAAKMIEKDEVKALIDAIGTVTYLDKDAIAAARTAYEAWIAGANAPDGFADAQFAVTTIVDPYVIENLATLEAAEAYWADLNTKLLDIHAKIAALADKAVAADFVDAADRTTYGNDLAAINNALDAFKAANNGSFEDQISEAEFAKIALAQLACDKYDAVADIKATYDAAVAYVTDATILDVMEDAYNAAVAAVEAAADKVAIDALVAAFEAEIDFQTAKFDATIAVKAKYDAALIGVTDTTILAKMELAYNNSIDQIYAAEDTIRVTQLVTLFDAEIDAAKNGTL